MRAPVRRTNQLLRSAERNRLGQRRHQGDNATYHGRDPELAPLIVDEPGHLHSLAELLPLVDNAEETWTSGGSATPTGPTVNASPASPFKIAARISRSGRRPHPSPRPVRSSQTRLAIALSDLVDSHDDRMSRLASPSADVAACATWVTTSPARRITSLSSTTSATRPHGIASSALSVRPVSANSRARCCPTTRGNR